MKADGSTLELTAPERGRRAVYYGWTNLSIAALAMVGTLPGRTQGLGLITEPLLADLQLDRVSYAQINLWATLIGALFCLPCGRLTDRFGSRIVLTAVVTALGLTVIAMSSITGLLALTFAVILTRGFGQSALSVVSLALVGKWFARRLNMAMGLYSLVVGFGFIAAFPSVGQAVITAGWRQAWLGVGIALLAALAPLAWILVRNQPEDTGLEPDGEALPTEPKLEDLTLRDALSSPAFWIIAIASSLFGLVYSGIALFNQSILEQRGFDSATYHSVLIVSTLLGLIANFTGGWLASKWSIQKLMGAGMGVLAIALAGLPAVQTFTHVMAYAAAMGIAGGIVTVVFFSAWGQIFGRSHLGRIQGCAQMMTVLASAIGPLLLAWTFRNTGSYEAIFYLLAMLVVLTGIASWFVPLPSREPVVT